ncbi:hypothetical protein M0802_016736 [Mischocyttarus mexicanus]|nr:hypothetical protein M0802_016736 [Mischocyttarus mexicanus]
MHEHKIDILAIQEPYVHNNSVVGMGINTKTVTDNKNIAKTLSTNKIKAAIVIFNKEIDVLKIEQLKPIDPYLLHIEKILKILKGKKIILCMDSNAKSLTWFSKQTDARGEALEGLLSQYQLHVINKASENYTFDNTRGQENIDVTVVSCNCLRLIRKWRVHSSETTSDHNLITFIIKTSSNVIFRLKNSRFNVKKADWEKYRNKLVELTHSCIRVDDAISATETASDVESAILKAAKSSIPTKTRFSKSAPWWNSTLTKLRKEVREMRRKYKKTIYEKLKLSLRKGYYSLRNKYISYIRKEKQRSWEKFSTEAGNKEPWSIVYKIQAQKLKVDSVLETLKENGNQTINLGDTVKVLLHGMIPDDKVENETEWQQSVRNFVQEPPNVEDTPKFQELEIENVIKTLGLKKAPGHDLIENEMVKQAWIVLRSPIRKSTEDAIVKLRDIVSETTDKYALGLMFDISGAFDGVWWPSVLNNFKKRDCPRNIYNLIRSYLSDRNAQITSNSNKIVKNITKGCPQGSVLGPLMWNLILDEVIEEVSQTRIEIIAYADDIVIVVSGDSRKVLEVKANLVTNILKLWCDKQKLELSASKSHMILLKGFLDIRRPPTVRLGEKSLKMDAETKYLGVFIGTRFNMSAHITHVSNKSKVIFSKLASVAKANWGLSTNTMKAIYKGVFVPIISYAAAGWADKINVHHKRRLMQAQRYALIRVTKAYRTISTDALCIIAGATPIDLLLVEKRNTYFLRRNITFQHFDVSFAAQEQICKIETKHRKCTIKKTTTKIWQEQWNDMETLTTNLKGLV